MAADIIPSGGAGEMILSKLNSAQFSRLFKGTLSKLKPNARGRLNRGINKGIGVINNTFKDPKNVVIYPISIYQTNKKKQ